MLDLNKLTDQEVVVLTQAVDLMVESTDIGTSDCLAVNTLGNVSTQLKTENSKRWRAANRPALRQHTLIIEVPADIPDEQAEEHLTQLINESEVWVNYEATKEYNYASMRVAEYHRERMINHLDEA